MITWSDDAPEAISRDQRELNAVLAQLEANYHPENEDFDRWERKRRDWRLSPREWSLFRTLEAANHDTPTFVYVIGHDDLLALVYGIKPERLSPRLRHRYRNRLRTLWWRLNRRLDIAKAPFRVAVKKNGLRLKHSDELDLDAEEPPRRPVRPAAAMTLKDCTSHLRTLLAGGELPQRLVQNRLAKIGARPKTIRNACSRLGVTCRKEGFGIGGRWFWSLPQADM
jgi:hypothetical protein